MNAELQALYEEDRADAQTWRADESFLASQARRNRVEQLLSAGLVQTAEDFFHAAFIFQHGEGLEHWAQAHLLARTAADLGHPRARYQAAAAYDRWLMRQRRPQKYGTNSILDGDRWRVWDTDPTTTDDERRAWDVPTWAELLDRGEQAFGGLSVRQVFAGPLVTAEVAGVRLGIFELDPSPPPVDGPLFGVPVYEPLTATDPHPRHVPANCSLWRFGKLFCAKNTEGQVLCSWHPCRWQVLDGATGGQQEQLFRQLAGQPQWMSPPGTFWTRLGLASGLETCWIVGGRLEREELAQVAQSL